MSEGFSDAPRRGRRDPDLQLQLSAGLDPVEDAHDDSPGEFGLAIGDEIVYKTTIERSDPYTGKDRWHTYGIKTSVQPNETEAEAFTRAVMVVHGRLEEAIEHADQLSFEADEARKAAPITPQRG